MSYLKKTLTDSFIYVVLGFLPIAVNFLLAPLYSHYLLPDQNGILGQANMYQGFLAIFLGLSIDGAFTVFYFDYYKKPKILNAYISTLMAFLFLMGIAFTIILFFCGDFLLSFFQKNTVFTYSKYGIWIVILCLSTIIQSIFLSYHRNAQNVKKYAMVSLSYFFVSVAFILMGVVYFNAGAFGSVVGRSVGYLFVTLILLLFFYYKVPFFFKFKFLKTSLKYSVPLVPYLLLLTLHANIDRILVERNFTLHDLGIYNFAFLISGTVSVLIYAIHNTLNPSVYKLLHEDEEKNAPRVNQFFKIFQLVNLFIMCAGLAVVNPFVELFIDKNYHSILPYIGVLFLAYIFKVDYIIYATSLFFYRKTKWMFLITLTSFAIGLGSNFILIPIFGVFGVCLSVLVINFTQMLVVYFLISKYNFHKKPYFNLKENHMFSAAILGVFFLLYYIFSFLHINLKYINYVPLISFLFLIPFSLPSTIKIIKNLKLN